MTIKEVAKELGISEDRIYQFKNGWKSGKSKYKPIFVYGVHYVFDGRKKNYNLELCKSAYLEYKGKKELA
jgi:hypothetical protein